MIIKKPKFWDVKKNTLFSVLLYPVSMAVIFFIFFKKFLKKKKFPYPVICVGNIYLGGTGKTPLVQEICKILKTLGKKPAIIKKYYPSVQDEIILLKKNDRVYSENNRIYALDNLSKDGFDTAVLDDGYQDFSIEKDLSIVVFNQKQQIGNGNVIPAGPLREKLIGLKRARFIFINGEKEISFENQLKKYNSKINFFYFKYNLTNLEMLKEKKICAFAGIGNPENFFEALENKKLNIVMKKSFPDHYKYSDYEINKMINLSEKKDAILLTTEKDHCRINNKYNSKIFFSSIRLDLDDKPKFTNILKKLYEKN